MIENQAASNDPVPITKAALDGLEAIRRSGATNMFDRPSSIWPGSGTSLKPLSGSNVPTPNPRPGQASSPHPGRHL